MRRLKVPIVLLTSAAILGLLLWAGRSIVLRSRGPRLESRVVAPPVEAAGFTQADGPREFDFPADYGPHPDYQTEWWYYTGNLVTADGRRFGYQLTFFRRVLMPPTERVERASEWATDQIYMAHFALTEAEEKRHQAFERFSRGTAGLAGAESVPYRVWVEDWEVAQTGDDPAVARMRASQEDLSIDLRLIDRKGPVLHGIGGYSQKGSETGSASYYYSQPRLETSGTVRADGQSHPVEGWSWMDHEFSTSALSPDQVGWDWFALRLEDGTDLMVFQIRKADGAIDPFSSGTLIDADGTSRRLTFNGFDIEVEETWDSPHSGARYPIRWTVRVAGTGLDLRIEPYLTDQELDLSYTYWEGAVSVTGDRDGKPVTGDGYVEMTGYAGSIGEQF
jgi:predicted secreted hydrolase